MIPLADPASRVVPSPFPFLCCCRSDGMMIVCLLGGGGDVFLPDESGAVSFHRDQQIDEK